jgi:leucyl-tRNA synthetase
MVMFTAPPEDTLAWNDDGVKGSYRFLHRLWKFAADHEALIASRTDSALDPALKAARRELHLQLQKVNFDYERKQFNTVATAGMKVLNLLESDAVAQAQAPSRAAFVREAIGILLRVLHPLVPHITQELWRSLGFGADLLAASWPKVDESALLQDEIDLVLQVNGKLRGNIRVARTADQSAIEREALANPNAQKHIAGQQVKRVVVVPGRLVNIVV